jgi:predicted outer membrane lipoprotein
VAQADNRAVIDFPWIIGLCAAIAFFAVFEAYALRHPDRQNTLSMAIYTLGSKFPISILAMGIFIGALSVHFLWHWCPPGSVSTG